MTSQPLSRRAFAVAAGSVATGLAAIPAARATDGQTSPPPEDLGISGSNSAIHQEVDFNASPVRAYDVLTDARLFAKVVLLSGAMQAMALQATPTRISPEVGGAFALFGGYITGRHLELTPGVRLIQAWRAGSWPPHVYSIVRFELVPRPQGVRLVFDHTGFPNDEAVSLATGWREHYWAPMAKVLA
jgi:uncharacterized protein YndB with AHSA1/START domain